METNPTIAASNVAGPAVLAGGTAYRIIARKTKASATDFLLWLTPTVLVMDTVKRLAARVKPRRTTHDNMPALVKRGNRSVDTSAEPRSNDPIADMPIRKALLFQVLLSVISMRSPHLAGLTKLSVNQPIWNYLKLSR